MIRAPGPKGHPLHGSWQEFRADPLAFLVDTTAEYGDFFCFRLGLKRCFGLADLQAIQAVFKDREGFADKPPPNRMHDAYPRNVARLDGPEHLERRRALAPAFQREAVLSRAEAAGRAVRGVVGQLRAGETRPVQPVLEDMALRSAAVLLMGGAGERVAPRIADAQPRVEAWLGHATDDEEGYEEARRALAGAILEAARLRRAERAAPGVPARPADLLDVLLRALDAGQIDEQVLIDEVVMMLVTHVPTAVATAWALYELARRPDVRASLEAELDGPAAQTADLEGAPLLAGVVLETLRLHPPVWVLVREAKRDFRYQEYTVSNGNEVLVSPYVLQRSPRYWRRPDAFLPERFVPGSPWHEDRPAGAFLPFGLGLRKCIGERTALLQMKVMLAEMLRELRFELPAGHDVSGGRRIPLAPHGGLPVTVERRRRCTAPPAAA